MIKQSICVLKCVNSLRGRWLSYKCITLFIPDSWFWEDSISQGFILCNFITWKIWKKGYFAIQTFVTLPYFSKCVSFWCLHKICTNLKIKIKMIARFSTTQLCEMFSDECHFTTEDTKSNLSVDRLIIFWYMYCIFCWYYILNFLQGIKFRRSSILLRWAPAICWPD